MKIPLVRFAAFLLPLFALAQTPSASPGTALAPDLKSNPGLPDDTRLWAALQQLSGGTWGGCVYDADALIHALQR